MFVGMFFMHFDTVQGNATKLSRNHPLIQEKLNDYFFVENKLVIRPQKAHLYI